MKKKHNFAFKSKQLIIIMTIVCVSFIVLTSSSRLSTGPVKDAAGYMIVPFQNGINSVGGWLTDQFSGFQNVKTLAQENKTLQDKIEELTAENIELSQDQSELKRLQSLYKLDNQYAEYEKIAAEVISKDPGNWYSTFMVNRGTKDGVAVDMNVISGSGLVGIVTEAGDNWASIRSIIDDSSNVSAMVESTLDTCMVTGDLTKMTDGKLKFIQLVDDDDKVQDGDKIITSNVSNKYLKGIFIGYISDITKDTNSLTKTGYLTPAVDFRHLQEVLIIKNLKQQKGDD